MTFADARTLLFVPGVRLDRLDRALASGADVVVCDLEDAVAPADKADARRAVDTAAREGRPITVRVNAVGTPWHEDDVAMAAAHGLPVVVPKAAPGAVEAVARRVGSVLALVETAAGLLGAPAVAATPGVERLAVGHLDLAADLGVHPDTGPVLDAARITVLTASVAAGLTGPVDGVTTQVHDGDRLAADLAHARALGYAGKLCIHPAQVAAAAAVFAPSAHDVAWARSVLAAHAAAGPSTGVLLVDGEMIDAPVLARARRLVDRIPPTEGERP